MTNPLPDSATVPGMRRCRCRGRPEAHLQHVRTAVAARVEHLGRWPCDGSPPRRRPTTFQDFLDQRGIPAYVPGGSSADAEATAIPNRVNIRGSTAVTAKRARVIFSPFSGLTGRFLRPDAVVLPSSRP